MQQQQEPIEGAHDSQATTPTRTGDDVPTSVVTPHEATTMAAIPFLFGGIAAIIAAVIMVLFIVFRQAAYSALGTTDAPKGDTA